MSNVGAALPSQPDPVDAAAVEPIGVSSDIGGAIRAMDFFRNETGEIVLAVAVSGEGVHRFHVGDAALTYQGPVPLESSARVWDLVHLPHSAGWPDLATVGAEETVRIFDVATGAQRSERRLPHPDELRVVETIRDLDGTSAVAAAGLASTVYLWRANRTSPFELGGHTGVPRILKALRDEHWLAVGDERGITIWDLSAEPRQVSFCPGRARSIAVLREHGVVRLASATADGIHLWDPGTGQPVAHFAQRLNVASTAVLDAEEDEQLLAVASDELVGLWSPATEARARTHLASVPRGTLKVLARILTGNGTLLAAGDERGMVAVWRLLPQRRITNLVGRHKDWVNCLAVVGPAHRLRLASASDDRTAQLWEVGGGSSEGPMPHDAQVHTVAAVANELVSGDQLGRIRRWPIGGTEPQWSTPTAAGPVRAMATYPTPQGWRIITGSGTGHCAIWDAADGTLSRTLAPDPVGEGQAPNPAIRAIAAVPYDGHWYVAAGDMSGRIIMWDADNGEIYSLLPRPTRPHQVRSLAVLKPGGRVILASGDSTGTIQLWDVATREQVGAIAAAHAGPVSSLCAIYDGQSWLLASGGADRDLRLWDPEQSDQPLDQHLNAHDSWVRTLAQVGPAALVYPAAAAGSTTPAVPVPTGVQAQLASGGEEGSIRLWQVKDGQLVRSTRGPSIRGFRDQTAKIDLLDRGAIARELSALLRPDPATGPNEPNSPDITGGPQVILIHGAWGTGKSSMMRSLRNRLERAPTRNIRRWWHRLPTDRGVRLVARRLRGWWRQRELSPSRVSRLARSGREPAIGRQPVRRTVTVWFNPWTHQSSEQVWSGLAWSIIDQTRKQLALREAERQHYWLWRNLHRLDPGVLRRTIRHRIWRPTLTVIAALLVPLALSMTRTEPFSWFLPGDQGNDAPAAADAAGAAVVILALLVLTAVGSYALWQYFFGRATAHLPAALFDGPAAQPSLATATGETLLRDPPYFGATGELHRINEDVHALIHDLDQRGYELVVFVDDLDRCTPVGTAAVFEAINALLPGPTVTDAAPRFVIGLDTTVVANQLAAALAEAAADVTTPEIDDPNIGWSLLRKLSQLTVILPGIRPAHSTRLLRQHTSGDRSARSGRASATTRTGPPPAPATHPSTELTFPQPKPPRPPTRDPAPGTASLAQPRRQRPGAQSPTGTPEFVALEGEPDVQAHLRNLVSLRPRQTMRETKRLLTLWSFYLRLLTRLLPTGAVANARDACDTLTLAEILRRWPAYIHNLGRLDGGQNGLSILIDAARGEADEPTHPSWNSALERVGLVRDQTRPGTDNLHRLLRRHGNETVAAFADLLL